MITNRTNDRASLVLLFSAVILCGAVGLRLLDSRATPVADGSWTPVSEEMVGTALAPFPVVTLGFDTIDIPAKRSSSIVVAYRTDCRSCDASLPHWKELTTQLCSTPVVLVSPEPVETQADYWVAKDWETPPGCLSPVIGRPANPDDFSDLYSPRAVPALYIMDEANVPSAVWRGAIATPAARDTVYRTVQLIIQSAGQVDGPRVEDDGLS